MGVAKTLLISLLVTLLLVRFVLIPIGEASYGPVMIVSLVIIVGLAVYLWLKTTQ